MFFFILRFWAFPFRNSKGNQKLLQLYVRIASGFALAGDLDKFFRRRVDKVGRQYLLIDAYHNIIAFLVPEMHRASFAIFIIFTLQAIACFCPVAVSHYIKFFIPDICKIIFVNIAPIHD
jgi:hypothetical protein